MKRGLEQPYELVLGDGTRVPLVGTVTIGRAPGNTIQLDAPGISRNHAQIVIGDDGPEIEDVGSTYGTVLDGRALARPEVLHDGARIGVGDVELVVEAGRPATGGGRTIVVPVGSSLVVPVVGGSEVAPAGGGSTAYPRVRAGWALKRLEAAEGERRYVLRDLRGGEFVRMTAADAELFHLLDGTRSLHDLVAESCRRYGADGPIRLTMLLAGLGEHGLLAGVETAPQRQGRGRIVRLLQPRTFAVSWAGPVFERLYRGGGFLLFTRAGFALIAVVAIAGAAGFVHVVTGRLATPFVVGDRLTVGGLVFLAGRFLLVGLHEIAHGLAVASFGRRVPRAGIKLLLIFPYAFVDTSEGWFEPSRRRLAISAAGPISDLTLGGAAGLAALGLNGTARDVFFQLAFGAYIGAFFNLNPLLERDGYHMLVDLLREPGLRRRSQQWLADPERRRAADPADRTILGVYALAALAWSVVIVAFTVVISRRYYAHLVAVAPRGVVLALFGLVYAVVLIPIVVMLYPAVRRRLRTREVRADVPA